MPISRIRFHRLAAREYRSARDWYWERSPTVAHRFIMAVDRAADRIVANAESLPALTGAYRYVRVAGFPYVLVFRRIEADLVKIVAVAHTSRHPRYWRHRQ